jgi:hypothetical protein
VFINSGQISCLKERKRVEVDEEFPYVTFYDYLLKTQNLIFSPPQTTKFGLKVCKHVYRNTYVFKNGDRSNYLMGCTRLKFDGGFY